MEAIQTLRDKRREEKIRSEESEEDIALILQAWENRFGRGYFTIAVDEDENRCRVMNS